MLRKGLHLAICAGSRLGGVEACIARTSRLIAIACFAAAAWGLIVEGNLSAAPKAQPTPRPIATPRPRATPTATPTGTATLTPTPTPSPAPSVPVANAATNVTSTKFTANWGTVSNATGYNLDVAKAPSFANYVSGYRNLNVGNVNSWPVTGLSPNTRYYYRVRAHNGTE